MFNVLSIGKSGLKANQFKMDGIADELANINNDGFKKRSISFTELLLNQGMNMGAKSGTSQIDYSQGILRETGGKFNMAIEGNGFFGVQDKNGNLMYTRSGNFFQDANNNIANGAGELLQIEYSGTAKEWDGKNISISAEGAIQEQGTGELLGRVMLYMPENLASVVPVGDNKYVASPGENMIEYKNNPELFGNIRQGFVEGSNGDITRAMTEMIITQRAYSLNASTVQSTDELMRLINEIKR